MEKQMAPNTASILSLKWKEDNEMCLAEKETKKLVS